MEGMGKLGAMVAKGMDEIERDHPDAKIGDVAMVCEIDSGDVTRIRVISSDERLHVVLGLLHAGILAIGNEEGDE